MKYRVIFQLILYLVFVCTIDFKSLLQDPFTEIFE